MRLDLKLTTKLLGVLALIEGTFMLPCVFAAVYFDELDCAKAFFPISLFCICIGLLIKGLVRTKRSFVHIKQSYLLVIMSWLFCAIIALLPMYLSGNGYPFFSCFFESVAALTTTGCTVLDMSGVPQSLLLWRAICHWLGGMGILVLLISVFPMWGISNQAIASVEMPGSGGAKFGSTYSSTGKFLYLSYFIFTIIQFILLMIGPMDTFNAILTSFSVVSTAGIILTDSNGWMFNLDYVKTIIVTFSILSSLNYVIYFMIARGRIKEAITNVEMKVFFLIIGIFTVIATISLRFNGDYTSLTSALKDALCQVVSFCTTAGYPICDYNSWPTLVIMLLFFGMLCGGCTSSTSGSLKISRVIVLFKVIKRGMMKHIHPNIVNAVVVNKKAIPAKQVSGIISYALLFFGMYLVFCLLLSFSGFDLETNMSTTMGMLSNTGLGFGQCGTNGYFGMFNQFSQAVMGFTMLAGRLEMYALLMLFSKTFWKSDRIA